MAVVSAGRKAIPEAEVSAVIFQVPVGKEEEEGEGEGEVEEGRNGVDFLILKAGGKSVSVLFSV